MKKIIAIVLAIVMMASMSVVTFAVDVDTQAPADFDAAGDVGGTDITYTTSKAYTVTVPANFILKAGVDSVSELSISNYTLEKTETLTVTVNSVNANGGKWYLVEDTTLTNTGASDVEYTITGGTKGTIVPGGVVATATTATASVAAETVVEALTFNTAGTSQVASFKDTITFTAAITGTSAPVVQG